MGLALVAASGFDLSSHGNILVNDGWLDGTRTDPASPGYAENNGVTGTDADADGNLESAWFGGGQTATTGHLTGTVAAAGKRLLDHLFYRYLCSFGQFGQRWRHVEYYMGFHHERCHWK